MLVLYFGEFIRILYVVDAAGAPFINVNGGK